MVLQLDLLSSRAVEGVRQRNIDAVADLRRLYEEHADFVRRVVVHLGGPGIDVDDLVQDVFVVAMRKSDSFEGRSAPRTWLYGIALKVVAGARRRGKIRSFLGLAPEAAADPETPAQVFERKEASRTVYEILDGIAEKKRTVFILFELEGLSGDEIATIVGCPKKTVWTRLHHARKEFQERLERRERQGARELARRGS
jgi:RNA polymerase sigma-70 factor (ECF subfamily)